MHYILMHRRVHVSSGKCWCLHSIFHSGLTLCDIWGTAGYLKQDSQPQKAIVCEEKKTTQLITGKIKPLIVYKCLAQQP